MKKREIEIVKLSFKMRFNHFKKQALRNHLDDVRTIQIHITSHSRSEQLGWLDINPLDNNSLGIKCPGIKVLQGTEVLKPHVV